MSAIDPNVRINLAKAIVLLVDGSQHSLDMMSQIMKGFNVAETHRCQGVKDAVRMVRAKTFDLLVIDPNLSDGDGYAFLSELRHGGGPNAFVPVILVSGHVRAADVARARHRRQFLRGQADHAERAAAANHVRRPRQAPVRRSGQVHRP